MNICLAIPNFPPQVGGISTFYNNLSGLLTSQDHKVFILMVDYNASVNDEDEILVEQFLTKVIFKKSYHILRNKYKNFFRPGGLEAYNWIAMGLAMRKWLLNHHREFDIEIIQTVDYGGLGFFLSDDNLPPLVVFGHGCLLQIANYNHIENDAHSKIIKKLEQLSFEKADAILTHSRINQTKLSALTGREIIMTLAPWLQNHSPIQKVTTDKCLMVISGLSVIKGALIMAEAIQLYISKNSSSRLRWIGEDTFSVKGRISMAGYLQKNYPGIWQKNFLWLAEKNATETLNEIKNSYIVVIPSVWETFSWVAVEAASLGKPIIITDNTGAVYLFTHGHDAWIVPANDPQKLAEAIELLSNNPSLCEQLGRNATYMIQRTFNNKENAEEKIRIYKQTIQNRQPQKQSFEEQILFLKKYTSFSRKLYYSVRAIAKKIIGR